MNKSIKVRKTKTKSSRNERKLKSYIRQAHDSDEDTIEFEASNRKPQSHPSNRDSSSFQSQIVRPQERKYSNAKNEEANAFELVDYISSNEELSATRYVSVGSKQTRKGSTAKVLGDEMKVKSLDKLSDKEDISGRRDKKNKD